MFETVWGYLEQLARSLNYSRKNCPIFSAGKNKMLAFVSSLVLTSLPGFAGERPASGTGS